MAVIVVVVGPTRRIPNSSTACAGQRRGSDSGGSLTTRWPPGRRNPMAHSAVTAGGPNDRAVTTSKCSRCAGSRARSSARPSRTATRSSIPNSSTALRSTAHRRCWLSSSTNSVSGRTTAITRPGTPPPLPRSRIRCGRGFTSRTAAQCPSAWSMCGSIAPGPSRPYSADRCNTADKAKAASDVPRRPRRRSSVESTLTPA